MLGMPQRADQGDNIEPELVLRQGKMSLTLGAKADLVLGALRVAATADLEPQADEPFKGRHGPSGHVGRPESPPAGGADPRKTSNFERLGRLGAGDPSRHGYLLGAIGPQGVPVSLLLINPALLP